MSYQFSLYIVLCLLALFLIGLTFYSIGLLYSVYKGAPYVSSGRRKAKAMLSLGGCAPTTRMIDLGSGDGEICLEAATRGAHAIGIDANPWLIWLSRLRARLARVNERTRFERADIWTYPLPQDLDLVTVYLLPGMYARVWEKLRKELRPGTKVVTHAFQFPGVVAMERGEGIYLYKL